MKTEFVNPIGFHAWTQGVLFILALYHLLLFVQNKKKIFLYYGLFVACLFYYFIHYGPNMFYLYSIPKKTPTLFYGIQFLAYIFYISYVREIASSKKIIPKWDYIFSNSRWVFLIFILIVGVLQMFNYSHTFQVAIIMFIAAECFAIVNYIIFYSIKTIPVRLIILGSVIYICLANCSLYDSIRLLSGTNLSYDFDPIIFMEAGAVIECLIFALVIGYKIGEIEREKNQVKIQLLKKSIEASEMKMTALKAQMNPHFIFNVLNSIHHFIINNDKISAANYLTKFAKLIRSTLENSDKRTITLQKELQSITQYIDLEKLRISNGFDYHLIIDPSLKLNTIRIPPLSLQPYIENAIWHGLSHKKADRKLTICIEQSNKNLLILIEDNGVGQAKLPNTSLAIKEKSLGTKITQERIKMLYPDTTVVTENILCTLHKTIKGTRVVISIPKIK